MDLASVAHSCAALVDRLLRDKNGASFWGLYAGYAVAGFSLCNAFCLLRGRGFQHPLSLVAFRGYFFSLAWLPVAHVCPSSLLSRLLLLYLPVYADLSEFHFLRPGARLSSWFGWKEVLGPFLTRHFDVKLVRSAPVTAPQVIIGLHPHAILPLGAVMSVVSDKNGFPDLFPTLQNRVLLAASSCFLVPGFREVLISNRIRDCSRFCAEQWIARGHTVCIVPGGAQEALYSQAEDVDWLDLRRKRGFIRLALQSGVPVVPAFTFNEVQYWPQVRYGVVPEWLQWLRWAVIQRSIGISCPFLTQPVPSGGKGSGVHLTTVVGSPLHLPHIAHPTEQDEEEAMGRYIAHLTELYNEHAPKYNAQPRVLKVD